MDDVDNRYPVAVSTRAAREAKDQQHVETAWYINSGQFGHKQPGRCNDFLTLSPTDRLKAGTVIAELLLIHASGLNFSENQEALWRAQYQVQFRKAPGSPIAMQQFVSLAEVILDC